MPIARPCPGANTAKHQGIWKAVVQRIAPAIRQRPAPEIFTYMRCGSERPIKNATRQTGRARFLSLHMTCLLSAYQKGDCRLRHLRDGNHRYTAMDGPLRTPLSDTLGRRDPRRVLPFILPAVWRTPVPMPSAGCFRSPDRKQPPYSARHSPPKHQRNCHRAALIFSQKFFPLRK